MIIVHRRYFVEAGHRLTDGVPEGHKCRRDHGHRYEIEVAVAGSIHKDGMVVEYGVLDEAVWSVLSLVDHFNMNTLDQRSDHPVAITVAKNPTVEHILTWMTATLSTAIGSIPGRGVYLVGLKVHEDAMSWAEWFDGGAR